MPRRYRLQGTLRSRKLGTTGTTGGPTVVGDAPVANPGSYRPMGAGILSPAQPSVQGGLAGTWTTDFVDEFTSFDTSKWSVREPWEDPIGYQKEEAWCPTALPLPSSVLQIDQSLLILKIRRQRLAGVNQPPGLNFTGVNINTRDKYTLPGGPGVSTFQEVRYNNPSGRGLWTAPLWNMGIGTSAQGLGWPRDGEHDLPEMINPAGPDFGRTIVTLHWYDAAYDLGPGSNYGHLQASWVSGADPSTRLNTWRTAGLLTTPDQLVYYDNSVPVVTWNRGQIYGGWNDPPAPLPDYLFQRPRLLLIDMKVGGGWAGSGWTNAQYEDGDLGIDYVRTWVKTG